MTIGKFALALACATALAGVAEAQQGNTINVPVSGLRNNNRRRALRPLQ